MIGYTPATWEAVPMGHYALSVLVIVEGGLSHYGVGPERVHPADGCPQCHLCGGLGDWRFGTHLACIQRQRQLGERWAWASGEWEA